MEKMARLPYICVCTRGSILVSCVCFRGAAAVPPRHLVTLSVLLSSLQFLNVIVQSDPALYSLNWTTNMTHIIKKSAAKPTLGKIMRRDKKLQTSQITYERYKNRPWPREKVTVSSQSLSSRETIQLDFQAVHSKPIGVHQQPCFHERHEWQQWWHLWRVFQWYYEQNHSTSHCISWVIKTQ